MRKNYDQKEIIFNKIFGKILFQKFMINNSIVKASKYPQIYSVAL